MTAQPDSQETTAPKAGPDGISATDSDPSSYLEPTWFLNFDDPTVRAFAERATVGAVTDIDKAVRLFYAVRDEIPYDPYMISGRRDDYQASQILAAGRGWCVQKGIVMAACARAIGLPARVGYADVKNHLCTPRLLELMGNDYFSFHGYVELWLDGKWIKATPVFNKTLCEKFGVKTQEFDGTEDALFQEFDTMGRRHMEYLLDRGPYTDPPFKEIYDDFWNRYVPMRPILEGQTSLRGDFHREAARDGNVA